MSRLLNSVIKFREGRVTVTEFLRPGLDLIGTFRLGDGAGGVRTIRLTRRRLDGTAESMDGLVRIDGNTMRLALAARPGGPRPASLKKTDDTGVITMTLTRAPAGFKNLPTTVRVKVLTPDGGPAAGVTVGGCVYRLPARTAKANRVPPRGVYHAVRTGRDGVAGMKYADLRYLGLVAMDRAVGRVAIHTPLAGGTYTLALKAGCRVTARITSPELEAAGLPVKFTNAQPLKHGRRVGEYASIGDGAVRFFAEAGEYTVYAYGEGLLGRELRLNVPAGRAEFPAGEFRLKANRLAALVGGPAPPLRHVRGWKGEPVRLTDFKGQVVLLEFWGSWCGPCVRTMPDLFRLHEKFKN